MQRYVGVVGPGDASADEVVQAREVGALLGDAGVVVVSESAEQAVRIILDAIGAAPAEN